MILGEKCVSLSKWNKNKIELIWNLNKYNYISEIILKGNFDWIETIVVKRIIDFNECVKGEEMDWVRNDFGWLK